MCVRIYGAHALAAPTGPRGKFTYNDRLSARAPAVCANMLAASGASRVCLRFFTCFTYSRLYVVYILIYIYTVICAICIPSHWVCCAPIINLRSRGCGHTCECATPMFPAHLLLYVPLLIFSCRWCDVQHVRYLCIASRTDVYCCRVASGIGVEYKHCLHVVRVVSGARGVSM